MSVIECQTYIDHGTITVPSQYLDQIKGRARIIILPDDTDDEGDMIDYLFEPPYHIHDFTPLTREELYERH